MLATSDLVPLLPGDGGPSPLVVIVAGTGTGFGARSADGTRAHASGCEYLRSDEGGGLDIGLAGLRAAVRAGDLRGPATALREAAAHWCGGDPAGLAGNLSEKVYVPGHKPLIAGFARRVLDAAPHDAAAAVIVARAASELAAGAAAVARRHRRGSPDRRRSRRGHCGPDGAFTCGLAPYGAWQRLAHPHPHPHPRRLAAEARVLGHRRVRLRRVRQVQRRRVGLGLLGACLASPRGTSFARISMIQDAQGARPSGEGPAARCG